MRTRYHSDTQNYSTKYGPLKIHTCYRSCLEDETDVEFHREVVKTVLEAEWLTHQLAEEYKVWSDGGFTGKKPSFVD